MRANAVRTVELEDQRILEYAEYGDPKGDELLFFHGFTGSYHQASPAHEAAEQHGFRIIAPNRPGVGHSSPHETKTVVERMDNVRQLLEKLDIEDFGVIGVSGGAPYALAAAHVFQTRVKAVAVISGMGTIADPTLLARMEPSRRRMLKLATFPLLARLCLAWRMRRYKDNPEAFLDVLIKSWPQDDQKLFERQELKAMFLKDLEHTLSIGSGAKGLAEELQRYFRWGFDPYEIQHMVRFLHGTNDGVVPPEMSTFMASRLQNSEISLYPGGHAVIVNIIGDVMKKLRETFT